MTENIPDLLDTSYHTRSLKELLKDPEFRQEYILRRTEIDPEFIYTDFMLDLYGISAPARLAEKGLDD